MAMAAKRNLARGCRGGCVGIVSWRRTLTTHLASEAARAGPLTSIARHRGIVRCVAHRREGAARSYVGRARRMALRVVT